MEPIAMILSALAVSSSAAKALGQLEAYRTLQRLIRRRVTTPSGLAALERAGREPATTWRADLEEALRGSGADKDPQVVAAAVDILEASSSNPPVRGIPRGEREDRDERASPPEGHPQTRGGGLTFDEQPPPPVAPEPSPVHRALQAELPQRAEAGQRISLLVRVVIADSSAPGSLRDFTVPPVGRTIVITVSAPELDAEGDLEQDLLVPASGDSDPVRFGFRTRGVGLQEVLVRAFAGGTFLGEVVAQVSVEAGARLEEGPPVTAHLDPVGGVPGEVTLQVLRQGDQYQFQLLGEAFYEPQLCWLASDPTATVNAIADELRRMAQNAATANPAMVRRRLKNLGARLWGDLVPQAIRDAFWDQSGRIASFTIISDLDTIPWELLYPVDGANENGFLAEQFPVVRRVYGQGRAGVLKLGPAAYVLPGASPRNALDEIAAVRAAVGSPTNDPILDSRSGLDDLLDGGQVGLLHFACHNTFTPAAGSTIMFADGPYRPDDLYLLAQRRRLRATTPLVFMNACRSAGEVAGLTQLNGWASQFMRAGAGAFVGTLWAVRSSTAKAFAERFYNLLVGPQCQPLGAASLSARTSIAQESGDPTWLAYTVYGNPFATVSQDRT